MLCADSLIYSEQINKILIVNEFMLSIVYNMDMIPLLTSIQIQIDNTNVWI